jgi:F-box associated protein
VTTISILPVDVHGLISQHLEMKEIGKCMRVSKEWNKFFKHESIWMPIAIKYKVQIVLIATRDWSLVHNVIVSSENTLRSRCSRAFLQGFEYLFGSNQRLLDNPILEIDFMDMLPGVKSKSIRYFKEKHYSAPIVIAIVKFKYIRNFLLLRFQDKKTMDIYRLAIEFITDTIESDNFFKPWKFKTITSLSTYWNTLEIKSKFRKLGVDSSIDSALQNLKSMIGIDSELTLC